MSRHGLDMSAQFCETAFFRPMLYPVTLYGDHKRDRSDDYCVPIDLAICWLAKLSTVFLSHIPHPCPHISVHLLRLLFCYLLFLADAYDFHSNPSALFTNCSLSLRCCTTTGKRRYQIRDFWPRMFDLSSRPKRCCSVKLAAHNLKI